MADEKSRGMSPFTAGLVGAIIGAIGSAVAIILSKPENRQKLKEKANDLRERGEKALEEMRHKAEEVEDEARERIEEGKEEVEKRISRQRRR